jgi:hypothetical protein
MPAMLLAVPYGLAAVAFASMADQGGWFSVLALVCVWNACKFLVAGPATLTRLVLVRAHEARAHRILTMLELESEAKLERRDSEPALRR